MRLGIWTVGWAGVLALALGAAGLRGAEVAKSQTSWSEVFRVQTPAGQELRGFGPVATEFAAQGAGQRKVWVLRFACQNPEKAAAVVGKFLADLDLSPKVALVGLTIDVGGKTIEVPAWGTARGVFIGGVDGAVGQVLCAQTKEELQGYLKDHPEAGRGAVEKAAYPTYLDRFDRYGWGQYGLDGYRGTHDWMTLATKFDGKKELKDPYEDLLWLVGMKNRFDAHLEPASFLGNADGIITNADDDWSVKMAREQGLPVSFRLYGSAQPSYHGWALRRFGEYQNRPADFLTPRVDSYAVETMLSWYAEDVHRYQAVKAMEMVQKYAAEPHVLGWMHPYGEVQAGIWEYDHGDYGPYAQANWRRYLQKHVGDLAEVSRLYARSVGYGGWGQVPVPEFATFAGLDGQVLNLGGKWWARTEVPGDQKLDEAWWKTPAAERYQGLREKWWDGAIDAKDWQLVNAPGGGGLPTRTSWTCTTWFRRSFTLTPEQLKAGPIYLYWFPISYDGIHSGERTRYHGIYLNGQKAGETGNWGAIEVSRYLKAGENQVALWLHGNLWQGRVFLSTEEPKVFPGLGDGKNRLWVLWRQWLIDAPTEAMATVLDGMRQADPNRPIKAMAPLTLGPTRYLKLGHDYGMFPHFTGEGMWFFPWYKRYAYLYDVPGSSETAGPAAADDPRCADQFDAYRRVFMAGLNSHDPVFFTQTYARSPYLRAWWEKHQPVLHQLGRFDLAGPQVLLFRSNMLDTNIMPTSPYPTVGTTRYVQSAWNWEIGRGTLQTLGQSYLYLDEQGIADGKMNGYKVMVDCGNEILTDEARAGIKQWVESGGTFVALPFTGRSSLLQMDAWPVQGLTGCQIGKLRKGRTGTVTIKEKQSVFRAQAGKSFADQGSSIDCVGNELNKYSVVLAPGPDCEVIATYENGAAAVVKRSLGRGSVITFGSVFWRNSQDIKGIWWPKTPEPEVIGDLLEGLGMQAECQTDGQMIWPQPYRSNNGLDHVAVLTSWNEDKDVTTTLRMRLPAKPAALVAFGVDGEKELDFEWKDGVAATKLAMPAREVKVVRALGTETPFAAATHWWNYQQRMWHELVKPTLDLAPYRRGKFADPTQDLRPEARFTQEKPAAAKWREADFDDRKWTPSPLSLFRFWGAKMGQPLWVRKTFTVPKQWRQGGGQIRMIAIVGGGQYDEQPTAWLNGTSLDATGRGFIDGHMDLDVTNLLRAGPNVAAWEFAGKTPLQAFQGDVYLYWRPTAVKSVPLVTGAQMVAIPQEWEGKYRVMLYLEGERYTISRHTINGHTLVRAVPFPAPAEFNLCAYLKYGQDNALWINPGKKPEDVTINRLDLYPIDE